MKIAFDVDGTLIKKSAEGRDIPRFEVIFLLNCLKVLGNEIFVWSGSGFDYAQTWCDKLGISDQVEVIIKELSLINQVDLAIDDEDVTLGKTNMRV